METSPLWSSILPGWYSNCRFRFMFNNIIHLILESFFWVILNIVGVFPLSLVWVEISSGNCIMSEFTKNCVGWNRWYYVTLWWEWIKSYLFEWFAMQEKTPQGKLTPNIQFWLLQTWSVWILPSPFRSFSCRSWNSPIETWKKLFTLKNASAVRLHLNHVT